MIQGGELGKGEGRAGGALTEDKKGNMPNEKLADWKGDIAIQQKGKGKKGKSFYRARNRQCVRQGFRKEVGEKTAACQEKGRRKHNSAPPGGEKGVSGVAQGACAKKKRRKEEEGVPSVRQGI